MTDLRDLTPAAVGRSGSRAAEYAQTGEGDPQRVAEDVADLAAVVRAAEARLALERGEGLTTGQLAALGSVTDGRVRQLVASGELPTDGAAYAARIPAERCREWLAARGVVVRGGPDEKK